MLSKSQARAFFLIGTALFSALFIGLTIDTIRQTGARTNEQNLTPAVRHGKEIWDSNNCMGCHTLLGEGAYYAPDLTQTYTRRGAEWIRTFMKDPAAMFPGERKMVKYNFTEQEITDLIEFLKWVGEIDTNGWPPEPNLKPAGVVHAAPGGPGVADAPEKYRQLCVACHALGGQGGNVGPALDGVASRFDNQYLDRWLKDPALVKPGTAMPKLPLTDDERRELVGFLARLK